MKIFMVINPTKFETSTPENIVEHIEWSTKGQKRIWPLAGIICNPHFADQTEIQDILKGYKTVKKASELLNIPIKATNVHESLLEEFNKTGFNETEVWTIKRFMPKALW